MTNRKSRVKIKVPPYRREVRDAKTLGLRLNQRELDALDDLCRPGVPYSTVLRRLILQEHARRKR